jgi:hypothetical protein
MLEIERQGSALLSGAEGERLKKLAESAEAQAVGRIVDTDALKAAAQTGDAEALKTMLTKVLSTDEGKRLAARLGGIMGNK